MTDEFAATTAMQLINDWGRILRFRPKLEREDSSSDADLFAVPWHVEIRLTWREELTLEDKQRVLGELESGGYLPVTTVLRNGARGVDLVFLVNAGPWNCWNSPRCWSAWRIASSSP